MTFDKPPLTLEQQLDKWQSRGLVVPDTTKALHYLRFIGYYRLSAHALPVQQLAAPDKPFRAGTSFEDLLGLYVFYRELRLVVMDAIERIAVAFRICLVNEMSTRQTVARGVNAAMVVLHWQIGQRIRKVVLREKRAEYGKEILATVSKELAGGFGRGFSWPNPSRMVALAEAFPGERIVTTLSRHLGWERQRKDLHT